MTDAANAETRSMILDFMTNEMRKTKEILIGNS